VIRAAKHRSRDHALYDLTDFDWVSSPVASTEFSINRCEAGCRNKLVVHITRLKQTIGSLLSGEISRTDIAAKVGRGI